MQQTRKLRRNEAKVENAAHFGNPLAGKARKSFLTGTADRVPNLVIRASGVVCAGRGARASAGATHDPLERKAGGGGGAGGRPGRLRAAMLHERSRVQQLLPEQPQPPPAQS